MGEVCGVCIDSSLLVFKLTGLSCHVFTRLRYATIWSDWFSKFIFLDHDRGSFDLGS